MLIDKFQFVELVEMNEAPQDFKVLWSLFLKSHKKGKRENVGTHSLKKGKVIKATGVAFPWL